MAVRSLGLVTLLPAGGPTGDGPGEVLASRPIDLERARAAPALPRSVPTRIQIPAIKVDAPITPLGLDENGSVQVPPLDEPALTGWYQSGAAPGDRKSTRLNSSHVRISYAVFCLKKKKKNTY